MIKNPALDADLQDAINAMVEADKGYSNGQFSMGALTALLCLNPKGKDRDNALYAINSNTKWLQSVTQ